MTDSIKPPDKKDAVDSAPLDLVVYLMLLGDSGVGKTSLMQRFHRDTYDPTVITTIGADWREKDAEVDGRPVRIRVWDLPGRERHREIAGSFLRRGANGVALIFDVTSEESFNHIPAWNALVTQQAPDGVRRILIGHKTDDETRRVVAQDRAATVAAELNMGYFECSSLTGANVGTVLLELTKEVLQNADPATLAPGVNLDAPPRREGGGCCGYPWASMV